MTEKHTDKRTILIVDDDADLSMLNRICWRTTAMLFCTQPA